MLNYEFPPMGGGAGNATYNIAKELVMMGHSVDVLTSRFKNQKEEEFLAGVRVYRVFTWRNGIHDCGLKGAYTYIYFAAFTIRKLCKLHKYDIVHYFFSLPTGLLSLIPGPHRKLPYIVSLRGSDVPYYDVYNKKIHIFNILLKPVNKHIWEKAKRVVALSRDLKKTAQLTSPDQPMLVIPNGIEADLFKPSTRRNDNGSTVFITVSRLINRKGIDHVLKALSELQNKQIQLLIVGTGSYEKNLKKLCNKLRLDDSVTFIGYCNREKLPELYGKADVFILPSLAESFGLVFAEAMACGLPIIGGRTGGVPDLVKEENGLLVEPGNVAEIKNAIIAMMNSKEKRARMGRENRNRVMQNYSWDSIALQYLTLYKTAIT